MVHFWRRRWKVAWQDTRDKQISLKGISATDKQHTRSTDGVSLDSKCNWQVQASVTASKILASGACWEILKDCGAAASDSRDCEISSHHPQISDPRFSEFVAEWYIIYRVCIQGGWSGVLARWRVGLQSCGVSCFLWDIPDLVNTSCSGIWCSADGSKTLCSIFGT